MSVTTWKDISNSFRSMEQTTTMFSRCSARSLTNVNFHRQIATNARSHKGKKTNEESREIWPKLDAITRRRVHNDYHVQSTNLNYNPDQGISRFWTWKMWAVNLVAIVRGSLQSVCLRCSVMLFSGLLRVVTSVLWLLTVYWGRPTTSGSILQDRFSADESGFADHFLAPGSSTPSCRSSLEGLLAAPGCCPRGMFFGSGIHLEVSNLLVSPISVCRRSSTRRSVYFFRQSTSALRLRWLRGDRDGLRCPLLSGQALS